MYSVIRAVHTKLSADAGVSTAVGTRIYPEARAQDGALPAIVLSLSEEESINALLPSHTTLRKARMEVMVVAKTAKEAAEITEKVREAMHGVSSFSYSTANPATSIQVLHCLHFKSLTNYAAPASGDATGTYSHSSMYSLMYQEA